MQMTVQLTMLNGARHLLKLWCSIVTHLLNTGNNIPEMMQQIKQSTINYILNTDGGDKKNIKEKEKGARCMVHDIG